MNDQTAVPAAGNVLVVATGSGWTSRLIRVGEALRGQACTENHVAVLHHWTSGVPWAIEGRPGGVGWIDARRYLRDPRTVTNAAQPITDAQRAQITTTAECMLGRPYDWEAIADDALESMHVHSLWSQDWHGQGVPGHVVCSSFVAWLYAKVKLPHPRIGHERFVFPSDWADFCLQRAWTKAPSA